MPAQARLMASKQRNADLLPFNSAVPVTNKLGSAGYAWPKSGRSM